MKSQIQGKALPVRLSSFVEEIAINLIKENPSNPRVIKDDKFQILVNSIKAFPEMLNIRPIVINSDMIVLGGNMRLKACIAAGLKSVPVIRTTFSQEKQKEFIIKDNISGGEWDWDMIANEWNADELTAWGLDIPDFALTNPEAEDDDFDIPISIKTDIVLGDVFEIGPHRLLCGDSTRIDSYAAIFDSQKADLVVTDPPYNVSYQGGNRRDQNRKNGLKILNDSMDDRAFYNFLKEFYTAQAEYTKPGGSWYVWHDDSGGANFRQAMKDSGVMVKQCLIWAKSSMVMGRQDYQWNHEACLYGWKEGAAHNWYTDRKQTTILEFDRPSRNADHPTMKPVPLIAYQIGNSSKIGDIVADPFGGSGTVMVASHQMERRCFMIELDPKYCQVIINRMINLDKTLEINRNGKPYKTMA
jgi:DNA modification methylase